MKFESKFRAKFNHEIAGASFGHKISGSNFGCEIAGANSCRKILRTEFAMKFRVQILTRSATAKFQPRNLKPQITKFKTPAASFGISALNFKTIAASFKIAAANFKISVINFKVPAARATNSAKAARLKILKFNASAANG